MIDLAIIAFVTAVALAVGKRLLRAVPFASALEEGLYAVGIGLGLFAYATLALGQAGLLYRPALLAVLALGAGYGWRQMIAIAASLPRGVRRWVANASASERAAVALGVLLVATELVLVLAPPVGGDQTKYQLVYPRLYAEAHRMVATPWSFWGYFQYLVNMLFTAAFVLRGDVLARLMNALFGVLTALAIFAAGRRLFTRAVGVWAALLFVTMPLTATLMTRAWVEFALTLYVLLALLAIMAWRENGAWSWLAVGALMAGLAAATKLIGLLVPGLLGVLVFVCVLRAAGAARLRPALATAVGFGLVAAVVASPCYLRNAVDTGNPIYPFGYTVFGGRNWSAAAAQGLEDYYVAYRETQAQRRGGHAYGSWIETLRFPWDATMAPNSFEESGRSAYDVGPFLLAFAPGVLLLGREPRAWILAAVAFAYGATVAFGMWAHPRYVHPVLPLLLLLSTAAAARAAVLTPSIRRVVVAVLAATVVGQTALSLRVVAPLWPDSARVALGLLTEEEFLRRNEPRYVLASLVREAMPRDGALLVLGMIPHPYYYVGRRFMLASPLEQGAIDYRQIGSVEQFVSLVEDAGVTHVVREREREKRAVNPVGEHVTQLWDGLLAHCEKVGEVEAGVLYRLAGTRGAA